MESLKSVFQHAKYVNTCKSFSHSRCVLKTNSLMFVKQSLSAWSITKMSLQT